MAPAVLWFRRDLRMGDLPALAEAAHAGRRDVVPLFVLDPAFLGPAGPNRRRFLGDALRSLDRELGGTLVLRGGDPRKVVPGLAAEVSASVVAATADFGPAGASRDREVSAALARDGRALVTVDSPYAVTPGTLRTRSGSPLRVFSAFRRAWLECGWEPPTPPVQGTCYISAPSDTTLSDIETGGATPGQGLPAWWEGLPLERAERLPPAGSMAAAKRLERFATDALADYAVNRDRPALAGTSGLSPYLRFGCIHPRTVLARLDAGGADGATRARDELAWREFFADVLWSLPASAHRSVQAFGDQLRWDAGERSHERFRAWASGCTGYDLVDAGMRQLLAEGWMHNRVRMVTASFLVKDLHLDWRLGARWFMWHLVDGDLASNQHNWQWVAGTGTDAAPFHRVFNPRLQQERFDPDGTYIARYLREGRPDPIVEHAAERQEALARFDEARRAGRGGVPEAPLEEAHGVRGFCPPRDESAYTVSPAPTPQAARPTTPAASAPPRPCR